MKKVRTSRGHIVETEEAIGNIQAAVEHILEIPELSAIDFHQVDKLRDSRHEITLAVFPDVDVHWHCSYKHLILARIQLKELIQNYISQEEQLQAESIRITLAKVEQVLNYVRIKYLKLDPEEIKDPTCIRCVEDYYLGLEKKKVKLSDVNPGNTRGTSITERVNKVTEENTNVEKENV